MIQYQIANGYCSKQDEIDRKTFEIKAEDDTVYNKMQDVADELPDHSPRFILLSYPLTLVRPPCVI
jgi:hypothetical protein